MRLHKSKSATALAVVLGFAASVNVHSQDTQTQPPVVVANPQTKLDITPAGTPIINIAKPRDDGTSYNVFSKLNVGREGMIFNNSLKLGSTTLGGQILANPNLIKSGQSARLILNEVIGGTRSDLNGPIEIFGPKASIIIANQSGISCDGCGFFNVERATLSTGRAVFGPNGAFSGLAVDGGAVEIAGKGLLAGNVEFFDIISASTSLNASLYARDLLITGGNGEFDYARRTATARDGNEPGIAIDSSLLGGMYANRIRLVGNGSGVGINLRGVAAALEGPLEITAQGDIAVANAVSATHAGFTSLSGNISINEQLFAGGNASLIAQGNIVQAGNFIAAAGDLNLRSGADIILGGRGLFAGLGGEAQIDGGGLTISAAGDIGATAIQAIASKNFNATARNMDWGVNSSVSASGIDLISGATLGLHGQFQSTRDFSVRAGELAISGAAIANGAMSVDAGRLAMTGDAIGVASTSISLRNDLILSANASLQSGGALTVDAATVRNLGRIAGVGATNFLVGGTFDNVGTILSGNRLSLGIGGNANFAGVTNANGTTSIIIAGQASVAGTIDSGAGLGIAADTLSLSGTISSGGNLDLKASGGVETATSSVLATDGALSLNAVSVSLGGYTSAKGALDVVGTGALKIGGQLHAGGDLTLNGNSLTMEGVAVTDAAANFSIGGAASLDGILSSDRNIQIQAAELTTGITSQTVASGDIIATTIGNITQRGIISGKAVNFTAGTLLGNDGTIFANGDLTLSASQRISNSGSLEANGITALASGVVNSNGNLVGIGGVTLTGGAVDLGVASNVQSGGALFIDAAASISAAGTILSVGRADLRSAAEFNQNAALSLGDAGVFVAGGRLLQNGNIQADGFLDFAGFAIEGSGGFASNSGIAITSGAGSIDLSGNLTTVGNLTFTSSDAVRLAGLIFSKDAIDITARGDFINYGQLVSEKSISVKIDHDFSQTGLLQAGGNVSAVAVGDITASGTISAGGTLKFESGTLDVGGLIAAEGALALSTTAAQKIAENAVVFGKADASLISGTTIDLGGNISSVGALSLSASALNLLSGSNIISDNDVRLTATGDASLSGNVSSGLSLIVNAADIAHSGLSLAGSSATFLANDGLVQSGTLQSGAAILLDAANLALTGTTLGIGNVSLEAVSVSISGALSSNKSIQSNSGDLVVDGTISSLEGIKATTENDMVLGAMGLLETNGQLSLVARNIDVIGRFVAGETGAKLSASQNFSSRGELLSGGDLEIDAGGAASFAGVIGADGLTRINAVDAISLKGQLGSLGAISISGRDISVTGTISGGSTVGLSSAAGISALVGSSILASGTISVDSTGKVDALGTIASAADVSILAEGGLLLGGTISADDNIVARGATLVTAVDSISVANKKLTFSASSALGNAGALSADEIDILSDSAFTNSGKIFGDLDLKIAANTITNSGDLAGNGGLGLTAQNIILNGSSEIQVVGALRIFAQDSLETEGNILAIGAATLTGANLFAQNAAIRLGTGGGQFVSNGSLIQNGTIEANGDIGLSGQIITGTGALLSDRSISFTAGNGGIEYAGNIFAKIGLNFAAPTHVRLAGAVTTDGIATVDTGTLTIDGALSAFGGLNFTNVDTLNIGSGASLVSGADLSLHFIDFNNSGILASNKALAIDVDGQGSNSGSLLAGTGLRIKVGGDFSNSGTVSSIEALTIDAGNTAMLAGLVQSEGPISVNAGNIGIDGALVSLGALVLSAVGEIVVTGSVSANLDANFTANDFRIGLSGRIIGGEDLLVTSAGLFENQGVFGAGGHGSTISIIAGNVHTHAGSVLQGSNSVTIQSLADIQLDGGLHANSALILGARANLSIGGIITSSDVITLTGAAIGIAGTLQSDKTLSIFADEVSLAGTAIGVDGITIDANGGVSMDALGRLLSDGLIDINAGNLQLSGLVQTGGNIDISVTGIADLGGELLTGNDLFVDAANVTTSGTIFARDNASLTSTTGDIVLGGALGTELGAVNLVSARDIFINGQASAKTELTADARDINFSGTIFGEGIADVNATRNLTINSTGILASDGRVDIGFGGAIDLRGIVSAGADLSLVTSQDLTLGGQIFSGGLLTIGGRDLTLNGLVFGKTGVTATGRAITLGSTGGVKSDEIVRLSANTNLTVSGTLSSVNSILANAQSMNLAGSLLSDGALQLTAAGSLTSTALLSANNGDILLNAATANLGGQVYTGKNVVLRASAAQLTADLIGFDGVDLQTAGGLIMSGAASAIGSRGLVRLAGDVITTAGQINSESAVSVSAVSAFHGIGDIGAKGTITVNSNGLLNSGNLFSESAINLSGVTAQISGFVESGTTVTAAGTNSLTVSGILVGGTVDLTGGAITTEATSTLFSSGAIDVISTGAINTAGAISAVGAIAINADNALTQNATLQSNGNIGLTASGLLTSNGATEATGSLQLRGGSITTGGSLLSNGGLSLTSLAGDILVNAAISSGQNTVALTSERDISLNARIFGKTGAAMTANRSATVTANGELISDATLTLGGQNLVNAGVISARTGINGDLTGLMTNNGLLLSGGGIAFNSGAFTNTNAIEAAGPIKWIATGPVSVNGEIFATSAVDIKSTASSLTIGNSGRISSELADVKLASAQAMLNDGVVFAKTGANLSATGATLTNTGQIVADGGIMSLAANQLNLGGSVFSDNALHLNGATINITGNIGAETSLLVTGGNVTVANGGLLQSNNNATLDAASLSVNGTLRTLSGGMTVTGRNVAVNANGVIESGMNLNVSPIGTLTNNGLMAALGALELTGNALNLGGFTSSLGTTTLSGGALAVTGLVESRGQLSVSNSSVNLANPSVILRSLEGIGISTSTLTNAGSIEAIKAISVNATAALNNSGTIISNDNVTLLTGGVATLGGNITAGKFLSANGATINQSGLLSSGEILALSSANGGITIGGNVIGQKAVNLIATGQNITFNANAELFGKDSLSASAVNINNQGKILSPGTITLNATNVLTQGNQLIAGVLASLTGGNSIQLTGRLDAGAVLLNAPVINVPGTIVANAAVDIISNNNVAVAGVIQAGGNFTLTGSATDFSIGTSGQVVSGGNVTLTGIKNLGVAGLLSATGNLPSAGNLSANYSGIANIGGRVEAGKDIILTSNTASGLIVGGATLIVPGAIIAGHDLTINGGATVISGTVYGDRNVNVSTASYFIDTFNFAHSLDVTGSGQLASGGNLFVDVVGDLNVVGTNASILSGGNATLAALTHNISGRVVAKDTLQFTNRGDLAFGSVAVAVDGLNLTGAGAVQSGGALLINSGADRDIRLATGTLLISNDKATVTGRDIESLGTVAAANLIDVNGSGNITFGGLTQSGDRISAHAGNVLALLAGARFETIGNPIDVAINRDQGDNTNIDLFAGNTLTNSGTIFSDGSVFLGANNAVTNLGTITGNFSVIAQSNHDDIENLGTMTGGSIGIFQNIVFHNTGTYVAATNLLIDAPEIFNSGLIGAGNNLTLRSGSSIINSGTLFAGNDLTLNAGTQVHNDEGTILALGNIAITAAELINDSARIESLGGDVTINSPKVVNRIKDLVIVGGGVALAPGFYTSGLSGSSFFGPVEPSPQDCGNGSMVCFPDGSFTVLAPFVSSFNNILYDPGFYSFLSAAPANVGQFTPLNGAPIYFDPGFNFSTCSSTNLLVSYTCSGNVVEVSQSHPSLTIGGGFVTFVGQYTFVAGGPSTGSITTNSGESQIVAAGDVTINGGANGTVTNRNSSILAGRDVRITTGTLNNESTTVQTATGEVLLPAIIRAGGTVSIFANQINNGTVQSNGGFVGGPNDSFNTSQGPGATGQGGLGSAVGPGIPGAGLNGGTGQANDPGTQSGGGSANFNVDHVLGGVGIDNITGAGTGSGPINGGAGNAGGVGSGPAGSGNVAAVAFAGQPNGTGGVTPVNAGGLVINGPGGVGSTGPIGVQANVGPTDDLVNIAPGGATGGGVAVGSAPSPVNGSTTTAQLVDGFNGQVVGITSVGTPSAPTDADSILNGGTVPDGQQPADLQDANPEGVPQTSFNGQAAATAALLDGFNGIAIPGIIGANGDAGSFVFDFLRQFDLIGGANRSLNFANGDGLFTFNDSPDADFLFSTNRGFDGIAGLFDSDYFFDQLDVDRGTHFTRLGDGFFESQLIGQQVSAATQQAQLPQFGTSLAQTEGLMASAVKQQKALQLSVGVALSASQVSALTESLVWWVSAKVNGREVLVPVVYLAKNDQKVISNGTLIAGTNVVAKAAGNITNSGTISGANLVSLTAGNDFINRSGGLITGGTVGIKAGNDIVNNAGAVITGEDIFLTAGRDIALSSTVNSTTNSTRESLGGKRFTAETITTQTATGSTIAATGNLVMNAGRDISISMGNVSAGGDATMVAGRDVLITGVTTTDTSDAAWKTGKYKHGTSSSSEETFHGSVIKVGGDFGINAGRDIGIIGSAIEVGDDLSMQASGGITIGAAETQSSESLNERLSKKIRVNQLDATATTHALSDISAGGSIGLSTPGTLSVAGATIAAGDLLAINAGSVNITGVIDEVSEDTKRVVKSGGMLSSKKTTTVTSLVDQSVIGSTLEGDRVSINSLGSVSIKGSNVVATGNLAITAGGAIDIGTMVEEDSSSNSVKVKKSGLSFSGGGLFVGVAKNRNDNTLATSTNVGSLIGSATGNVTLNADGALKITGSDVVAPGTVNLIGDSVTIANAIDTATSTSLAKSSSFGVSVKAQSSIVDTIKTVSDMAKIAADTESSRVAAVSLMAGGLAIKNGIDAGKDIADAITSGNGSLVVTVSASLGFAKSKSTSAGTDQSIVGSNISGGNVNIVATGSGDAGFVRVTGSDVVAANNLMVLGNGPITFEAATETDTNSGKSSSFGASIGVSAKVGLEKGKLNTSPASVDFGMSSSKSSFSSTDVTHREATLSAGGTAMIGTPGALAIDGAIVSGGRVDIDAGSLAIASRQDTSSFRSNESSMGINVSVTMSGQVSASGNMSRGKQVGEFASVAEQAGVFAGTGGFDINVTGNTDLKGGVIASEAAPDLNRLVTGKLTFSDIENVERYKASSLSMGVGIGANLGQDREGDINTNGSGKPLPGIATPIGTISATVPVALGASGSQTGTTHSAIAPGAIVISSGDAASQQAADTISRDTDTANKALEKEFTAEKRDEIQQGFAAVKQLVVEVSTYFANRASDQKAKEEEAEEAEKERDKYPPDTEEYKHYEQKRKDAAAQAKTIQDTYGPGSPIRLIATALTGAAGGNVTGSVGSMVQSAAVNVLQGLAAEKVKELADGFKGSDAERETLRAALHAVVGCAGQAAGGGDCGSGATGAAASVVLNALLSSMMEEDTSLSLEEQQARTNLAATLIGAIAAGAGLDPGSTITAVQIEMENNDLTTDKGVLVPTAPTGGYTVVEAREKIEQLKSKPNLTDEEKALLASLSASYGALITQYRTEEAAQRAVDSDVALEKSTKSDAAFAGGTDELKEFFLKSGTLEDLRADKKAYLDAYVASSIDNFDLTDEQKQALQAEYAAGAKASDIYLKAYEQSVGPINAAIGKFGSEHRSEIEHLQFLVDLLPTSRAAVIVTAGTDVATSEHSQNEIGKIFSTGEIAENAAIMAVIAQRQARQTLDVDDRGGYRIETINGKKVFVGKPPLDDPKAGVNPEFNDPKHKVGFDGEVRLAQEIQAKVPGQVVISYGNGAGVQGADVVTVDADGNVYLYDNRVRNSGTNGSSAPKTTIQDSSALIPKGKGEKSAATKAIDDIEASNLPKHIKEIAKAKLSDGTYFAITVGDGTGARNSAVQRYVDGVATNPNKVTTKLSGTSKPKGF